MQRLRGETKKDSTNVLFGTILVAEKEEFNFGGARFDALFLEKLKNLQSASVKKITGAPF